MTEYKEMLESPELNLKKSLKESFINYQNQVEDATSLTYSKCKGLNAQLKFNLENDS